MGTGARRFTGATRVEILYNVCHGSPTRLRQARPGLSTDLEATVGRMLAKSRHDRFQDMAAVLEALRRLDTGVEATAVMAAAGIDATSRATQTHATMRSGQSSFG